MTDFSTMTPDELTATVRGAILEVESRIANSTHAKKGRLARLAAGAHAFMGEIAGILQDSSDISPDSAGGPKPE